MGTTEQPNNYWLSAEEYPVNLTKDIPWYIPAVYIT